MSYARYLDLVTQTLRDKVLPTVDEPAIRDELINCLRIVSRLAMSIELAPEEARLAAANEMLPEDIREAFKQIGNVTMPAESVVLCNDTEPGMARAVDWLETEDWIEDPEKRKIALELIGWERNLRHSRNKHLSEAEIPVETMGTGDETENTVLNKERLQDYLRPKLNNKQFNIVEFNLLSGGRGRRTALFVQKGAEDWPASLVIQCDPVVPSHHFPGVEAQFPLFNYLKPKGVKVPDSIFLESDKNHFGSAFMIVERMPGSPPNPGLDFFAKYPSEGFALSIGAEMGKLHSLSAEPMAELLPTTLLHNPDWAGDVDDIIQRWNELKNGPSLEASAILMWMRKHQSEIRDIRGLVHGDMLQHNMLMDNGVLSAVLDWEATRIGHPGEDVGYVRPFVEQVTSWKKFMDVYLENGGTPMTQTEIDFFTFRMYLWIDTVMMNGRNMVQDGIINDIRLAECASFLVPGFLGCAADVLAQVLQKNQD